MAAGDIKQKIFTAIASYGDPATQNGAVESEASKLSDLGPVEYLSAHCEVTRAPGRLPDTWPYWTLYTQLTEGVWQTWGTTYAATGMDTDGVRLVTEGLFKLVGTNLVQGDSAILTVHYRL